MIDQLSVDLQTSLDTLRQIYSFQVSNDDVDQKLLDQCSELIEEFLEGKKLVKKKQKKSRTKQESKGKKIKRKKIKRKTPKFNQTDISSNYPCVRPTGPINCPKNRLPMPRDLWYRIVYSEALEKQLDRESGGRKKVPALLDYHRRKRSASNSRMPSKRKHKKGNLVEDSNQVNADNLTKNRSTSTNPRQQQTMNAAISSISNKIIELEGERIIDELHRRTVSRLESSKPCAAYPNETLEYITETLPLETNCLTSRSNVMEPKVDSKQNVPVKATLWTVNLDRIIPTSQSAHVELLNRPKIYRGISADAALEHHHSLTTTQKGEINASMLIPSSIETPPEEIIIIPVKNASSHLSNQEPTSKTTENNSSTNTPIQFNHPLINQLFEYYHLEDIPRHQLFKQLNRRLKHIRHSLKRMSSNEIELKLKYKREALVKKRQTPVQSLTKDERIAMAELELNVYEYVQSNLNSVVLLAYFKSAIEALDEPSSKSFHVSEHDMLPSEPLISIPPALPLYDSVGLAPAGSVVTSESSIDPSLSTFDTVRLSPISHSTARLSTITQLSDKTEVLNAWIHPLETNLLKLFEPLTPHLKARIRKQLARRYKHIRTKAQQLSTTQLEAQIDSKSKALEQSQTLLQPNKTELLRIAELELSVFELRQEHVQRQHTNE